MHNEFIAMKRVQSALLIFTTGALILAGAALAWLWGMV